MGSIACYMICSLVSVLLVNIKKKGESMELKKFAKSLVESVNEDYSESSAIKIANKINIAKFTFSEREEILNYFVANESISAHLDFVNSVRSKVNKN